MNCVLYSKEMIEDYLMELKMIMTDYRFNINEDLDILIRSSKDPLDPYTTLNTLSQLEYDKHDIYRELLDLKVKNYSETLLDDKNNSLPPFFVFGKIIQSREVYIKVKIRSKLKNKIFCISFHFARYQMKYPYKN